MTIKVSPEVLQVLANVTCEGNQVFLGNTLDRKLYLEVDKVLRAAGGRWDRKAKAHLFEEDAFEKLDEVVNTGEVTDEKKQFQFYPTPDALADRMVQLLGPDPTHAVLEPSAGDGALLRALKRFGWNGNSITAVEKVPKYYNKLRSYYGGTRVDIVTQDFLDWNHYKEWGGRRYFDRIIMNPPFTRQQDIEHVTHALSMLAPRGVLVAILSAGVTFRQDRKTMTFKELVSSFSAHSIEKLPEGSFKESGTNVNATLLVVRNDEG